MPNPKTVLAQNIHDLYGSYMSAARRASIPLATIRHWGYRNYIPNNGLKRFLLAGADKKEIDLLLKNVREVPPMVDMAIKLRDEGKDWEVFLE